MSAAKSSRGAGRKSPKKKAKAASGAFLNRIADYEDGQHPLHVYLSGLSPASARVTGTALESIADILSNGRRTAEDLAWHLIRAQHVATLRGRLQKLYAPATANRYLTALRQLLRTAWKLELVDKDTIERALDVAPIKGRRAPKGRAVGQDELRKLFEACRADDNEALGARDLAIFAVLYGGGLRRAELARLDFEDFDFERYGLLIRGKGNKERRIFLPRSIEGALQPWVDLHRGSSPGPFFVPVLKNGALQRARYIHPDVVYNVTQKRLREAGLEAMTPHDLRRTFISDLLDRGVDITTVSHHVGHASVQTTARYDRRGERALEAAAEEVQLPLGRPAS